MAYSLPDWMEKGNCVGVDPDLMFPGRGRNNELLEAKAICAACIVKDECLEFALEKVIQHGVWGGKSERERRRLRNERRLSSQNKQGL